ncbi:Aldo/keto reductase [Heliocybe sulcata]|uniref:Aldo/keto reductase n=1 Tax=Heliocybe sulcata TaxID=5364 RepID=A0A5C3NA49_9AGAM|nr:Aldo/keto reductase [Heliocybe sulcata]
MSFPSFPLNNGMDMPGLGIGCWMGYVGKGEDPGVTKMVSDALKVGYRHIDTVSYRNERAVGIAIRESGIQREDIFVTTKLTSEDHGRVSEALQKSLGNLSLDYIDLFLMHWPQTLKDNGDAIQPNESPTFVDTWKDMENLLSTGKVKGIGVSNFSVKNLEVLLKEAKVVPAVNQVELHPLLPQLALLSFCSTQGIRLTAYTPLGKYKPVLIQHQFLQGIVESREKDGEPVTPSQGLLSWSAAKGIVVVPKCRDVERMKENMKYIRLTPAEISALDEIHKAHGMHRSVCGFHTKVRDGKTGQETGGCFGWTYEDLGWDMKEGGIIW